MTRILRAAGIAAAAFAFCASATFATPAAQAGDAASRPRLSLDALVQRFAAPDAADPQLECLANAVYFEARGEPVEGQLAVADVVLNRAASGHYPANLCKVVTQKAQFSFVRHGHIPAADKGSEAWSKAVAIAQIAGARMAQALPQDVLWYHAAYVAPSWRHALTEEGRIGLHIFYS